MDFLDKIDFAESDILGLLNNVEESIHIEFKSANALSTEPSIKKEISKDISAFANSDGGIIFYGINEENHIASSLSFIDGNKYSKEWLENVILSNIQQKINDIKIFPIRFDKDIKKTIYVVKIPKSLNYPHINGDKKYYRRYNFQSVPMEEYEIWNCYQNYKESKVSFQNVIVNPDQTNNDEYVFNIEIQIANDGTYISRNYKVACNLSGVVGIGINYDRDKEYNVTKKIDNSIKISTNKMIPLFPDELLNALNFKLIIPKNKYENVVLNLKCKLLVFSLNELFELDFDLIDLIKRAKEDYF